MPLSDPTAFRAALLAVPPIDRDAWLDRFLGLESIPEDGPELPRGCVPYLPCSVNAVLRFVALAKVSASDVVVDIGSGVGRAAALIHLLTGATVVGIEVQPQLAGVAQDLTARLDLSGVSTIAGDATEMLPPGVVYFLYCPFGSDRVTQVLAAMEAVARTRPIRIGCVDMPVIERPWLKVITTEREVTVYGSRTFSTSGGC